LHFRAKCTLFVLRFDLGVSVKIPVLTVVGLTFRDTLRFAIRHPTLLLITLVCSVPFEFALAVQEADTVEPSTVSAFVTSWLISAIVVVIWLPALIIAVRETVFSENVSLSPRQFLSASTYRYGLYSMGMLLVGDLIAAIPVESLTSAGLAIIGAIAFCFILLRVTLTFTALALGRLDLGFDQSYRRTTGQTLRLLGVTALLLTIAGLIALGALIVSILAGFDPTGAADDAVASPYPRTALGLFVGVCGLTMAVAGAHIYRLIEGAPAEPQNGRY
jgi:hypothetical protein